MLLYDSLLRLEPTPIVRLNRAVALSEAGWPSQALEALNSLHSELNGYQPYHAARAELLARDGQVDASRAAYEAAIALSISAPDIAFLKRKAMGLRSS